MTTVTVCARCGVRQTGVLRQCPECGGSMEWVDVLEAAIPATHAPAGCHCGTCQVWEGGLVVLCSGTAMALANAGGTL